MYCEKCTNVPFGTNGLNQYLFCLFFSSRKWHVYFYFYYTIFLFLFLSILSRPLLPVLYDGHEVEVYLALLVLHHPCLDHWPGQNPPNSSCAPTVNPRILLPGLCQRRVFKRLFPSAFRPSNKSTSKTSGRQSWALEVFFNFFNNKKWFFPFFIKSIWLGVGFLNRTGAAIGY